MDRIDLFRIFARVVECASFTRAAEAMDATQSAVSLKIKRLEDGLGRRLLERTPRRVRLTAAGQIFLERARLLIAAHGNALDAFASVSRSFMLTPSASVVTSSAPKRVCRPCPEK